MTQQQGEEASFLVARNKFSKFPELSKKSFYSKCFTVEVFITASKKLEVVDEKFAQFLHYRKQLKKSTKNTTLKVLYFPTVM